MWGGELATRRVSPENRLYRLQGVIHPTSIGMEFNQFPPTVARNSKLIFDHIYRELMSNRVGEYLDIASNEKECIRKTLWSGFGLTFISNETRTVLYFMLAILAIIFGVLVASFEDFPGAISKPWMVIVYDVCAELVPFVLIMLESSYPAKWSFWHFFSGALGLATSIGRACMIAPFIEPWTPIPDRFNVVGVGCTNTINWVYPLMARPVDRLPGVRVGQPLHEVRNPGKGLNSHERADLLDVAMTVCLPRPLIDGSY